MKFSKKQRWLALAVGGLLLAAALAASVILAGIRHQRRLATLKGTFMTVADYQAKYKCRPLEYGEFRKCSFVSPAHRQAPELAGLYYCGLTSRGEPAATPMVVEAAEPRLAANRLLRRNQQVWIQFTDGRSEALSLAPDAVGLQPVLEALLRGKIYPAEIEAKIRQRFAELENKLEKPRFRW